MELPGERARLLHADHCHHHEGATDQQRRNGDRHRGEPQAGQDDACGHQHMTDLGFLVIDDQRARDLMSSCATDASHFYVATNGDALKAAFRDIALKISKLRLTH